ncbi:MAG: peptidoglycan-binding protein [Cardiobacteriaceae bacterium]|nr:peptidoglycan-binding protein [Cardiobacteriaceae bacterium]
MRSTICKIFASGSALLLTSLTSLSALAQNSNSLSIPVAKAGQCQALVVVPAQFKERIEHIPIKEAAKTYEIRPAEYEWIEEQIMVKPAGEELRIIPATYKTTNKEIEVEPRTIEKTVVDPVFTEIDDEIVSRPSYMVARGQTSGAFNAVGEAVRLEEIPEQKETITRIVVKEPARIENVEVDAKYETVAMQEIDQEARVEKVQVEAEYQTVRVRKEIRPQEEIEVEIPAEYAEVKVFDKVADAQMRWEDVLCDTAVNSATIINLQKALNARGYDTGTPDGSLGPATMRALEKYQREHNLGIGGVTQETLRSLGVSR